MEPTAPSHAEEPSGSRARLRRVAVFGLTALLLLNLAVGGFGYFHLEKVERSYSKVLSEGIPLLNDLQSVTAEATRSYGSGIELTRAVSIEDRTRLTADIQSHLAFGDRIYAAHNLRAATPERLQPNFDKLIAVRQEWRRRMLAFAAWVGANPAAPEAAQLKQLQSEVYPALRSYLTELDTFCDDFQAGLEKDHRALIESTGEIRTLLVRVAAFSPLLLALGVSLAALPALLRHRSAPGPFSHDGSSDRTPNRWIFPDLLRGVGRPQKQVALRQKSKVIWLYGLSGAGKTAIAEALERRLFASGYFACMLDGDAVRSGLSRDLGFSDAARGEHIRRVAEVAKLNVQEGLICIVAVITPRRSFRKLARSIVGQEDFVEVFVSASVETCAKRDPKGLYSLNKAGQLRSLSGVDSAFEAPDAADGAIIIDTETADLDQCATRLFDEVVTLCRIDVPQRRSSA